MANRFLGEAVVDVDGKKYTLRCDFNAMCDFEEISGKNALETFQNLEGGSVSVTDMRNIAWAFLKHHHPDATRSEAGALLSSNVDSLMSVIQAASPTAEEAGDMGNGAKMAAKRA